MYQQNRPEKQIKPLVNTAVCFLFLITVMAAFTPCSLAHNVFLTAHVEGDLVIVESGFSDGMLCDNAKIEVFDLSGNKLLEGKTDENGVFSFPPPQKDGLRVVLNAGMGHRDEYTIPADELPDMANGSAGAVETAPPRSAGTHILLPPNTSGQMTSEQIEIIVDRVIQKRLRPLTQLVAKSQRSTGVSATEIFGGIGYIMGLMGIVVYCKFRKASTD